MPATIHIAVSSLIFIVTTKEGVSVRLKIRALRSIQTSQQTRMTKDLKPLRGIPRVPANADHHSWTEAVCFQFIGSSDGSPSQVEISTQIHLVNLHSVKRCIPVWGACGKLNKRRCFLYQYLCRGCVEELNETSPLAKCLHLKYHKWEIDRLVRLYLSMSNRSMICILWTQYLVPSI